MNFRAYLTIFRAVCCLNISHSQHSFSGSQWWSPGRSHPVELRKSSGILDRICCSVSRWSVTGHFQLWPYYLEDRKLNQASAVKPAIEKGLSSLLSQVAYEPMPNLTASRRRNFRKCLVTCFYLQFISDQFVPAGSIGFSIFIGPLDRRCFCVLSSFPNSSRVTSLLLLLLLLRQLLAHLTIKKVN